MVDIDSFKRYNDRYGHQAGDEALIQVAVGIKESIRRPADYAARYGGEEFIIILPDTPLDGAQVVAENLRKNITNKKISHKNQSNKKFLSVSCGIAACIPQKDQSCQDIIDLADNGLYKAKKKGGNCIEIYESN